MYLHDARHERRDARRHLKSRKVKPSGEEPRTSSVMADHVHIRSQPVKLVDPRVAGATCSAFAAAFDRSQNICLRLTPEIGGGCWIELQDLHKIGHCP